MQTPPINDNTPEPVFAKTSIYHDLARAINAAQEEERAWDERYDWIQNNPKRAYRSDRDEHGTY